MHLPLLRGSLLTAALLVFVDVMKELPATLVMRPFNFDTLATQAYTLAADERLAEASTAALAIVAVGLLPCPAAGQAGACRPLVPSRSATRASSYFQPARSAIFCAVTTFFDSAGTDSVSALKLPSAASAGLSVFTLATTGHSLLPSAK